MQFLALILNPRYEFSPDDQIFYPIVAFALFLTFALLQYRSELPAFLQSCASRGLCPRCCYDLQGKDDAGCPECGRGREAVETS